MRSPLIARVDPNLVHVVCLRAEPDPDDPDWQHKAVKPVPKTFRKKLYVIENRNGVGADCPVRPEISRYGLYILSLKNCDLAYVHHMESHAENKEALEQVEKATESESTKSKDLLESEDLQRKVGDSKKRITDDNTSRPSS